MNKQKHFILIRGLTREAAHWDDFPEILLEKFPSAKVTSLDLPGVGVNLHSEVPLSVEQMTHQMRSQLPEPLSENEDKILISVSLGGMVATAWMKLYPQDFRRMIIINSSFKDYSYFFQRLRPSSLKTLIKIPFLKGVHKEKKIIELVTNHKHRLPRTLELWHKISQERPVTLTTTVRQLLAASRFKAGKMIPHIPVLLLASTQDRMVSVNCSRKIAKNWNVTLKEHPTGGHDLSNDDPHWIALQISEWITD